MIKKINILSITLLFLIGCSENITPVDSGLEQQIYHHGNGSEPQGIDPHIVTGVPEHHILMLQRNLLLVLKDIHHLCQEKS